MNGTNLIITVALMAIVIAYLAGYVHGHRSGKADEQQELEKKHSRIASKQQGSCLDRKQGGIKGTKEAV